jgi:hypothetical protein
MDNVKPSIDPHAVLKESAEIIGDRGQDYGGIEENFNNIATIANSMLSPRLHLRAYDVAIILTAVKMARIKASPKKRDNYVDGVNYLAFAAELAK